MLGASAVAVALVLAACSSSPSETGGTGTGPPPARVLRAGIEAPQTLDPAQARSPAELLLAEQLFDSLTTVDPATSAVRPALAADWQVTPDQRHWEFRIRPGTRFASGRDVTADDVRFSLERIARKGSSSPVVRQLELVTGFRAFNVEGRAPGLAGVVPLASDRVRIDLDQSLSVLPAYLAHPAFAIVPRDVVEADPSGFAVRPVGSGPFRLDQQEAEVIRLVPNRPGGSEGLEAVELIVEADQQAAYDRFLQGGLDWAAIPPDRAGPTQEAGTTGARPGLTSTFFGFNLASAKLADARFREAVLKAIDREALVRAVYGPAALPAGGVVPGGAAGATEDACGDRCRADASRARELLAQVFGGRPPPQVAIDFDDSATQQALASSMKANLEAVGIPVVARPRPFMDYLRFVRAGGDQEIFRLASVGAAPTPDAFLVAPFLGGQSDNVLSLKSPDVDRLLRAARGEPDESRRTDMYRQAEKLVLEQSAVVPLAQFQVRWATSKRVRDLAVSAFGTFDAASVRLDPQP